MKKCILLFFALNFIGFVCWGQTTRTWTGTTSTTWLTTTNWSGGTVAGSTTSSNNDIAYFNVNTNAGTNGINMNTQGGNHYLGAINWTSSATTARTISNSSSTVNGILYLNGVTLNSVANTILWNESSTAHIITNGSDTMDFQPNNATNNVIQVSGAGNVTVSSRLIGANPIQAILTSSGGFVLGSANQTLYSGELTVSSVTAGSRLTINNNATAFPNNAAFRLNLNTGSTLFLNTINTTSILGHASQIITINSTNTSTTATIAANHSTNSNTVTIASALVFSGDTTRIDCTHINAFLAMSGNLSGSGAIVKDGPGSLTFSGDGSGYGADKTIKVNGGTLRISRTTGVFPSTTSVTVASGATFRLFTSGTTQTIKDLDLSAGGNLTVDAGCTLTITGAFSPGTTGTINNQGTIILEGTAAYNFPGGATVSNMAGLRIDKTSGVVSLNKDFTISTSLNLLNGILSIGSNTLTLGGTVSRTSGFLRGSTTSNLTFTNSSALSNLFFDHTTPGTTNALNNFTKSSGAGSVTIGNNTSVGSTEGQLYINGVLTVSTGSLDVSGTVTGNHIVLVSDGSNQARVANLTGGTITQSGSTKIIVERFINGVSTTRRAWRFITAPLTASSSSATIQNQWQNGSNVLGAGFGTNINGPVGLTGRDEATPGYSMRGWDYGTKAYANVTNTTTEVLFGNSGSADNKPYMMFIRGDKSALVGGSISNARLRAVGRLQTGDQAFTYATANTTDFVAVANPYASPVDWESVRADGLTNINSNVYYLWDPRVNSFGGWVTVDATTPPYTTTPSSPTSFTATNSRYIQNGQAFFVKVASNGTSGITFKETHKTGTSNNPTVTGAGNGLMDRLGVDLLLVNTDNSISVRDGLLMKYKNNFTTAINETTGEDVLKMNQSDETISIMQGSTKLGIEGRGFIQNTDTIKLQMERMVTGTNYKLAFFPTNFDATVTDARLIDKFLNIETPIDLNTNSEIPFTITTTTGSNAADRFMIVFRGTGNLPNNKLSLVATKKDKDVQLTWNMANEAGVKEYELQRSVDGTNFQAINNQVASNKAEYNNLDTKANNGINYYRVKMTMLNDDIRFSNTITLNLKHSSSNIISIYPNPIKGNIAQIQLNDLAAGDYTIKLIDMNGKLIQTQPIKHQGGTASRNLSLTNVAVGTYQLILEGKGINKTVSLVKGN